MFGITEASCGGGDPLRYCNREHGPCGMVQDLRLEPKAGNQAMY